MVMNYVYSYFVAIHDINPMNTQYNTYHSQWQRSRRQCHLLSNLSQPLQGHSREGKASAQSALDRLRPSQHVTPPGKFLHHQGVFISNQGSQGQPLVERRPIRPSRCHLSRQCEFSSMFFELLSKILRTMYAITFGDNQCQKILPTN